MVEILEVLRRPELTRTFRTLHGMDMRVILALLAAADVVDLTEIPAIGRDPKDDKFLATAALASADYRVSEGHDLLVLNAYAGVRIINAAMFLAILEREEGNPRVD